MLQKTACLESHPTQDLHMLYITKCNCKSFSKQAKCTALTKGYRTILGFIEILYVSFSSGFDLIIS